MRQITKDIQFSVGGSPLGIRLTKLDAFSGVSLMRLILRLQNDKVREAAAREASAGEAPANITILDLIASLSEAELRSVMTSCLNCTEVLLPAGPHPVMSGEEWGYPELRHDTASCLRLVTEEIAWSMDSFFGAGGSTATPAGPNTSR